MTHSVLHRVVYELLEFEASVLDVSESNEQHCIDREIRFEMSDGSCWFASWSSSPVQYCVGIQQGSFFTPPAAATREASGHPLWRRLINQPIEFIPLDDGHQVIEVRSPNGSAFLSSQDGRHWCADVTTVSRLRPDLRERPTNTLGSWDP
jgi:hypothetical protein